MKNFAFSTLMYRNFVSKATNGVVLATEKKQKSILYDEQSIHKVEMITKSIGMVYSGMGPDYRFVRVCVSVCVC